MTVYLLVIDGLGIWSHNHSSTYNILQHHFHLDHFSLLPNLCELGFDKASTGEGNLMKQLSKGVGSLEGHREMLGFVSNHEYVVLTDGVPIAILSIAQSVSSMRCIVNKQGRGKDILPQYWAIHRVKKAPIIYTGLDSTISIAYERSICNFEKAKQYARIVLEELVKIGKPIRKFIIREFLETWENKLHEIEIFTPIDIDKVISNLGFSDYSINTKIQDIFGFPKANVYNTADDKDCFKTITSLMDNQENGLVFFNLGDFDYYAHNGNFNGCLAALIQVEKYLRVIISEMSLSDYLILTSDHGVSFKASDLSFSHINENTLLLVSQKNRIYYRRGIYNGHDIIYKTLSAVSRGEKLDRLSFSYRNI